MWTKQYVLKSSRNGVINRYVCVTCGKEEDILEGKESTKKCKCKPKSLDSVWKEIVRSASGKKSGRKALEIDITKEFIVRLFKKQKGKCAISGERITLGVNASLDRIDSGLGYVKKNVQWVHKDINMIKGMYSLSHFLRVCKQCIRRY